MAEESLQSRFGSIAIEKGFITSEQFFEAVGVQIEIELEGTDHIVLGTVLEAKGYITFQQTMEVLQIMSQ